MGSIGANNFRVQNAVNQLNILQSQTTEDWLSEYGYEEGDIINPITDDYGDEYWDSVSEVFDKIYTAFPDKNFQERLIERATMQDVPMNKIKPLQNGIDRNYTEQLIKSGADMDSKGYSGTGEVILVKYKGTYWVLDGNHRVAAAKLLGQQTIKVRVYDLSKRKRSK